MYIIIMYISTSILSYLERVMIYGYFYLDCSLIVTFKLLFSVYCKMANICGGFNFAMFTVDDFSAKLKPPRSFYDTSEAVV